MRLCKEGLNFVYCLAIFQVCRISLSESWKSGSYICRRGSSAVAGTVTSEWSYEQRPDNLVNLYLEVFFFFACLLFSVDR